MPLSTGTAPPPVPGPAPSPGYQADPRKYSELVPQGVVKEVVFLNGKQDSKTTIAVRTLLSYLQVGLSAFWIIHSFLLGRWEGLPRGLAVRKEWGLLRLC